MPSQSLLHSCIMKVLLSAQQHVFDFLFCATELKHLNLMQDMTGAEFELLHIHVTPTKLGHVRVFVHFYVAGKNAPLPLKIFPALVPEWYSHLRSLEIIDGDNTFLVTQVSTP